MMMMKMEDLRTLWKRRYLSRKKIEQASEQGHENKCKCELESNRYSLCLFIETSLIQFAITKTRFAYPPQTERSSLI